MAEQALCCTKTRFGECAQPAEVEGLCFYHYNAEFETNFRHDLYYEQKLVEGRLGTTAWMSPTEVNALMKGRPRCDGRRIDDWTVGVGDKPYRRFRFPPGTLPAHRIPDLAAFERATARIPSVH